MELNNENIDKAILYKRLNSIEDSRENLLRFTETTFSNFKAEWFHVKYYDILNRFANSEIKNLIISMPPQHGKSEGSSRRLPAYLVGTRPDLKIALVSYSSTKAEKFGREIMNVIREPVYSSIFPKVKYPKRGYTGAKANTNKERESINTKGSMKFVGVEGALTGDPVDVLIIDDLYKDWQDGNSPTIQEKTWDWYISVADTRLHNDSQQLIVFTRWSDNDLIAKLESLDKVVEWNGEGGIDDVIKNLEHDEFLKINLQAIKDGEPNSFDTREHGKALWESRHSLRKLKSSRDKDPDKFDCLHQGSPTNKEGLMYKNTFKTYSKLPASKSINNYTDTADTGKDRLCSVTYCVPLSSTDEHLYIVDVVYTDKPMEVTEVMVSDMLVKNEVNKSRIESNNGGRSFARNVDRLNKQKTRKTSISWFHQSKNKESRIFSNSATVNRTIVFPDDWHIKWSDFYKDVTKYKKVFSANKFDDAPDVLTGIVETEDKKQGSWGVSRLA